MQILPAHDDKLIPQMRVLFEEYAAATGVDLCFQGFSEELAGLPGEYAPPEGRLFLAKCDGQPAGCVALRRFDQGICEMKRLYVRPSFRGKRIGRALAAAVIEAARDIGYRSMRLDTLAAMQAAVVLYRSMGFRETAPYYDNPLPDVLYFNLDLP